MTMTTGTPIPRMRKKFWPKAERISRRVTVEAAANGNR